MSGKFEGVKAFGSILTPLVIALIGFYVSQSLSNQEARAKVVEVAIDILRSPQGEENPKMVAWAMEEFNNYSGVKLSEDVKKEIRQFKIPERTTINPDIFKLGGLSRVEQPLIDTASAVRKYLEIKASTAEKSGRHKDAQALRAASSKIGR